MEYSIILIRKNDIVGIREKNMLQISIYYQYKNDTNRYRKIPEDDSQIVEMTASDFAKNYELLKILTAYSKEEAYEYMQGEIWSPNGEAKALLEKKGLSHTSMMCGDIMEIDGSYFMVADIGFAQVNINE